MTIPNNDTTLFKLLDKADRIANKFQGGYSGQFLSGEEFHKALSESIKKLRQGDKTQIYICVLGFCPYPVGMISQELVEKN